MRTTLPGERPSDALEKRGVEYVEVRALDVNCLEPTGVSIQQLYFTEVLVLFCLLESSANLTAEELHEIEYNELTVALRGRTRGGSSFECSLPLREAPALPQPAA